MKLRDSQVELILWDSILARVAHGEPSASIERILISDSIAGVDLVHYCPVCKEWGNARVYVPIRRSLGETDA